MRRCLTILITIILAATVGSPPGWPLPVEHSRVVSADPVDWTPHVLNGIVRSIAVLDDSVVVAGQFTQVSDAASASQMTRYNIFAFQRNTGRIHTRFIPEVNGAILAVAPGPDGTVYIGGTFTRVNGRPQGGLARLRLADGSLVEGVGGVEGGEVRTLATDGQYLYVGGAFTRIAGVARTALARLNAHTGQVDPNLDLQIASPSSGRLRVETMDLSLNRGLLVIGGTFTQVAGQPRHHIALINTSTERPSLTQWSTRAYAPICHRDFDTYLRGVAFSPDGSFFVVTTTGRTSDPNLLCNTAARWEASPTRADARPTWVNHTGGDSLYGVEVTAAAVYVGGHQRWLDNPYGNGEAGPGAVSRPGIGAIHPITGRALSWNPTRTRGVGVQSIVAVPEGLLVGSDTDQLGGEYHGRLGMFPINA